MATNTGKGHRQGAVKGKRAMADLGLEPQTKKSTDMKSTKTPRPESAAPKAVTKEKRTILFNPNIPQATLIKAQRAVQAVMSRRQAA